MPGGRPSDYSPEVAERVCEVFERSHESLRSAFAGRDDLPDLATVYRWEAAHPEFRERLTCARASRAHIMAETALEVADEVSGDTITRTNRDGEAYEVANHEWINRSRLRVETRLRLARAMNPRVYADKVQAEVSGPQGGPITIGWKEGA